MLTSPCGSGLPGFHPQFGTEASHQLGAALRAIGDVVGEEKTVTARRLQPEETVESRDPFDAGTREAEQPRNPGQARRRQITERVLRLDENLEQAIGPVVMLPDHPLDDPFGILHELLRKVSVCAHCTRHDRPRSAIAESS
jgi:hypothetical protein